MKVKTDSREECGVKSTDYGSYGYPCHLPRGHKGRQHEVLDKDDCPHQFGTKSGELNGRR